MVDRPGTCRVTPSGSGRSARGRAYDGEAPRGSVDPGSARPGAGAAVEPARGRPVAGGEQAADGRPVPIAARGPPLAGVPAPDGAPERVLGVARRVLMARRVIAGQPALATVHRGPHDVAVVVGVEAERVRRAAAVRGR